MTVYEACPLRLSCRWSDTEKRKLSVWTFPRRSLQAHNLPTLYSKLFELGSQPFNFSGYQALQPSLLLSRIAWSAMHLQASALIGPLAGKKDCNFLCVLLFCVGRKSLSDKHKRIPRVIRFSKCHAFWDITEGVR